MSYLAIYAGIICGYILRFFKTVFPKKPVKKRPGVLKNRIIVFGAKVVFYLQAGLKAIVHGIQYLADSIKYFWFYIWGCIKRGKQKIALYSQKQWNALKTKMLANNYIYICAKVAQIYSESGNSVRLLAYNSIPEHCRNSLDKVRVIEPSTKRSVCLPAFFELSEEKIEEYYSPDIYVADLHNICIFGGSSILLSRKECLYDPFVADSEKRLDIKFSNIVGKIGDRIIVEIAPPARQLSSGIFLMGFASYNYYHLSIEIMSRLKYVDSIKKFDKLPLVVDEVMMKIPQFKQLIGVCNVLRHPIIEIAPDETVEVRNLIFPSYNTWMPINVKQRELIKVSDFLMAKSGLDNIRSYINFDDKKADRNIFISRKNLKATRLGNEAAVVELFRKYGFEIIYAEELTYMEQVSLFHQAKCVAGASGAALTNIVYCQPGSTVVCIIPEEYKFYMYSTMAYLLGLKPLFLDAFVTLKTPYTASDIFEMDLEYCERFLKTYFAEGSDD